MFSYRTGISAYLILVIALFAMSCAEPAELISEAKKPRIALIMKSLANEFFATMAGGAENHHRANAERYDLVVNGIKDERDLARQVALVDEMVAGGVDAIVIAPADSKALVPALARALAAGVVIVNIDNKLNTALLENRGLNIPFVGPDNRVGARLVGEHLAKRLSPGDEVIVLEGTRTSFNAQQRLLGFQEAMLTAGATIVDKQSANWEMTPANTITTAMLTANPDVGAILAANDNMALGAMAAVRAAGRDAKGKDQILIVGFDNITAVQQAIQAGKILATVDQHADQLAVFGIDFALAILASEQLPSQNHETPVDLITIANLSGD